MKAIHTDPGDKHIKRPNNPYLNQSTHINMTKNMQNMQQTQRVWLETIVTLGTITIHHWVIVALLHFCLDVVN